MIVNQSCNQSRLELIGWQHRCYKLSSTAFFRSARSHAPGEWHSLFIECCKYLVAEIDDHAIGPQLQTGLPSSSSSLGF
jgi:hypothetical protein